jgi:hypothetical protein
MQGRPGHDLSQIQDRLAKLAIFSGKARAYRSMALKNEEQRMNLYSGLLFLHGHIADPTLAVSLAADRAPRLVPPVTRSRSMDLFKSLMYLGGRPMHSGHNYDLEEPFEPEFGNHLANERMFGKTLPQPAAAPRESRPSGLAAQGCG